MPKKPNQKRIFREKSHNPLWATVKWLFLLGLWAVIVLSVVMIWVARDVPKLAARAKFERRPSITVVAADGSVVSRYGDYFQGHVNVKDLPPYVAKAVMAIEDRRFYYHIGVDPIGLTRAIFTNLSKGDVVQGGSTITQQLAKNLFLTPERSLERKLQELLLSFWLEARYSKDEILSAYLNRVYYGAGAFGIEAAARVYYDRPAKDLTLYQAAVLAGILKAPGRYAPHSNPERSAKRAQLVLQAMESAGYIDKKEIDKALASTAKPIGKSGGARQYYTDWIVDQVESYAGETTQDIIVRTTFEPVAQKSAEKAFDTYLEQAKSRGVSQGAVVVMRSDGAVIAIIGGVDYGKSPFNRATQALRQPGSSFKPFVYLTAVERGIAPNRLVLDAPYSHGAYHPQNYDGQYRGPMTLRDALRLSLNTAALRLGEYVGINKVIDVARRAGISSKLEPNISLSLGSSEVTLLDITAAYATFARMGEVNEPFGILEIKTAQGQTLYNRERDEPFYRGTQRFRAGDIAQLRSMLFSVVCCGTGTGARLPGGPWGEAMGKTGTSQDYHDAWFMGFTDDLVAGVWMGNDDNKPMKKITGGTLPAPLWRDIMTPTLGALYNRQLTFAPSGKRGYMADVPSAHDTAQDPRLNGIFERLFMPEPIDNSLPPGYERRPPSPSRPAPAVDERNNIEVPPPPPQDKPNAGRGFEFNE